MTAAQEDEKRTARNQLEALLLEGLKSGKSVLTTDDWQDIREKARAHSAAWRAENQNAKR